VRILIVEDEAAIRVTLKLMLELNGHTVSEAADGPAGVARAAERPELILCDIGLPGLDGYQVLEAVQQIPGCREVPFIFLTARAERDDQRRGMTLGADDYITKPFTEREILDAIASRVRRQQPLRERIAALLEARAEEAGADWSHELLTPLNAVLGGLELIEAEAERIGPAELRDLLGLIRSGAVRQERLSRKLIRFFELERLKTAGTRRHATCEAAKIVAAGVRAGEAMEERAGATTIVCADAKVRGTADHVTTAVAELVSNALRFSAGAVSVTGAVDGAGYRIDVTDDGPGMAPEERAGIGPFRQFKRAKQGQQGLGLGLAIAAAAAAQAGGGLELQAGPGGRGVRAVLRVALAE
jgi:two-component system sensor histidine kinase/response regulator